MFTDLRNLKTINKKLVIQCHIEDIRDNDQRKKPMNIEFVEKLKYCEKGDKHFHIQRRNTRRISKKKKNIKNLKVCCQKQLQLFILNNFFFSLSQQVLNH